MKKSLKQSTIDAIERAAMKGDVKAVDRLNKKLDKIEETKSRARKRPVKIDRWRGDEKPSGPNPIELMRTKEGRSKLSALAEENKRRWSILGSADDAEARLKLFAATLSLEWESDFPSSERGTPAERDLSDAAFRLHCLREAHKREDLETASCHLYALGQFVERLRVRVMESLSRLGKAPQKVIVFQLLDDAYAEFQRKKERGVDFSANAIWSHVPEVDKIKPKTRENWFTRWKKERAVK